MLDKNIALPSKPKVISEQESRGIYQIDGFYPGYGHTIGNSLRRIMLSSLPGAAITQVKIEGVGHEFSTLAGVKEDVIAIILNLKKLRIKLNSDEPQKIYLNVKGVKNAKAGDMEIPSQVTIFNPELAILTTTDKNIDLKIEMLVENGLGYVPKEDLHKDRIDIGNIILDGVFTPIRRVHYETENMRVGDRTDFNRLIISVETDGTISPREALEKSIEIMITQLKAIIGFKEDVQEEVISESAEKDVVEEVEDQSEFLKTRIENLNLSARTANALEKANIRTIGGLARKKEEDILDLDGLGNKGLEEIKKILGENGIELK